jgi:hypothetical protein
MTLDREDLLRPINLGDLDACIRTVDGIVADRAWDDLLWFAAQCRAACERGHQLWPADEYALGRAALDATGPIAAQTLIDSVVEVGLGPRAEIAASTHTWEELAAHVPNGPVAVVALYECVARGADCSGVSDAALPGPSVMDLPRVLLPWEPAYACATYASDHVECPPPSQPTQAEFEPVRGRAGEPVEDDSEVERARDALRAVTRAWRAEADIVTRATAVEGDIDAAILALVGAGPTRRRAPIAGRDALAHLAWAAASGGPHGRRRGAAIGRADAWHIAALLAGFDADAPLDPDALGVALGELVWAWWDDGNPRGEWSIGLAVADPVDGIAWALDVR